MFKLELEFCRRNESEEYFLGNYVKRFLRKNKLVRKFFDFRKIEVCCGWFGKVVRLFLRFFEEKRILYWII